MAMVGTTQSAVSTAIFLGVCLLTAIAAAAFIPWQQSIMGAGRVTIFSPMERPQNIEAQITGRIVSWRVRDGELVSKGQLIAELADLDPKFLDAEQPRRMHGQQLALQARREAASKRLIALQTQLASLKRSQSAAVPTAYERAKQASDRVAQAEQLVLANNQNLATAELNLARLRELYGKGLRSKRDLELAELDVARARTEQERAVASVVIAKRDTTVAGYDQSKVAADTEAAIANVAATMAQVQETIESISADILKLEIDLANVQTRVTQRQVVAPCAGRIVRLLKVGASATVDAGTVLAVIAPETQDLAVELLVSDNDAPLVSVGRPVRLQFAGWPALQFAGWPSIAVGTFAGRVAVIDAVDDGKNQYRVIVRPDTEAISSGRDDPWPSSRFLRPGAEANGWIMLDTVPLGFELWRQFNAFPPTVNPESLGLHQAGNEKKNSLDIKRKSK
jgi:membrane fusion protein, adhesin transport system